MTEEHEKSPDLQADRQRGILTKRDRELILSRFKDLSPQQERDARYRIRTRIEAALLDLSMFASIYPSGEYASVLQRVRDQYDITEITPLPLTDAAFMFAARLGKVAAEDGYLDYEETEPIKWENYIEDVVQRAVANAESRYYDGEKAPDVDVTIDISHDTFDEEALLNKLVFGSPTHGDYSRYLHYGDRGKLRDKLREHDTEIVFTADDGDEVRIGPDHPLLDPSIEIL